MIGDCAETRRAGIDAAKIPVEGFVVKTAANRVYLVGSTQALPVARANDAAAWAVADFLERFVGVRWYWPAQYGGRSVPRRTSLAIAPAHYRDQPVFRFRTMYQDWYWLQARSFDEQLRAVLQRVPNDPGTANDLGLAMVRLGRFDEAITHYKNALKILPDNPDILCNLGLAWARKGEPDRAIDWLAKTLETEPGHPRAHANLGVIHSQRGRHADAAHHFSEALRTDADHTMARNGLVAAMLRRQEGPGILATLLKSIQTRPNAALHRTVADVLAHQGEFEEALRHYRQAVRLQPEWPPAIDGLAWHLGTSPKPELRDPVEAERLALSACELTGYDAPYPVIALGAALAAQGKFAQAVRVAEKAMSLAESAKDVPLAKMIAEGIRHYRAGRPYRQAAPDMRQPATHQ